MAISDDIKAIRIKYTPKDMTIKTSTYCRNEYARSLGECAKCGMCGRTFNSEGVLIDEANETE